MNYEPYQNKQSKAPTTLSAIGAVIISVIATLLLCASAVCLCTDGENAMLGFFSPALFSAGVCLALILLIHDRKPLFISCACASVLCAFVLCGDAYRSLICLSAFVVCCIFFALTKKKHFTCTGYMLLVSALYAVVFICMAALLCYEKYGEFGIGTLISAYEEISALIMSFPAQMIEILESEGAGAYADLIAQYEMISQTLEALLSVMIYLIPAYFFSICGIAGFITVSIARAHRRMLCLEDVFGEFRVSMVSAVVYLVSNLLILFVDPYTPIGITLITISTPLELALAYSGIRFGLMFIKKAKKGAAYYVVPIVIAAVMPTVFITFLAYLGSYRSIFSELVRGVVIIRKKPGGDGDGPDGDSGGDDKED